MTNPPDFIQMQMAFAAHIRNPQENPAPGQIEARRMKIYSDLFYNNIENFIRTGFPVLRKITGDVHWHNLVRNFYQQHRCHSPYFLKISEEFLHYLQHGRQAQPEDPAFLLELAHYEWVELALSVLDEECEKQNDIDPNGDLCKEIPVLSSAAWSLAYRFPVHKISPDYLPTEPPEAPTYLVVYRDADDQVRFLEVNRVTARLLQFLEEDQGQSGEAQLHKIALELQHPQPEQIIQAGVEILQNLRNKGVIVGTRV